MYRSSIADGIFLFMSLHKSSCVYPVEMDQHHGYYYMRNGGKSKHELTFAGRCIAGALFRSTFGLYQSSCRCRVEMDQHLRYLRNGKARYRASAQQMED